MGKAKIIASMLVMGLLVVAAVAVAVTGDWAAPVVAQTAVAQGDVTDEGAPVTTDAESYPPDVYGVVYGDYITKDAVVSTALSVYGNQLRDLLMDQALIRRAAEKAGVECTDADIQKAIADIESRLQGGTVKERLAQMGMSYASFLDNMKYQVLQEKLVKARLANEVKSEDLDTIHAYHILLRVTGDTPEEKDKNDAQVKAQIEALKSEITSLETFKAKAAEVSQDVGNAEKGGELGEFGRGVMVPEFEQAVFTGDLNTVIGPVSTTYGYHLIWIDKRVQGKDMAADQIETAKSKKIEDLYAKRGPQEQRKLIEGLKAEAEKAGELKKPRSFGE